MHKIFFFFICILGEKIIGKVFLDAGASLAAVLDSSTHLLVLYGEQ